MKTYYGFTANFAPVQKAKKENVLDRYILLTGKPTARYADLLADLVLNDKWYAETKTITHGMITGRYGKEWGELKNPRTEYYICSPNENKCIEINKTQYDFCNYISNTFAAMEQAEEFARNEAAEAEAKAEAERLAEEKARQEEKAARDAMQAYKNMTVEEAKKFIGTDFYRTCTAVYEYYYGNGVTVDERHLTVLIEARDIENPIARGMLKERLHNDNKASIKIFELYTGLVLPKTYKERMEFLDTIHPDMYAEKPAEFHPRKKPEAKEMNLEKFYRCIRRTADGCIHKEDSGVRVDHKGMTFFIAPNPRNKSLMDITEATTGVTLDNSDKLTSLTKCKNRIKEVCEKYDVPCMINKQVERGVHSPWCEENNK